MGTYELQVQEGLLKKAEDFLGSEYSLYANRSELIRAALLNRLQTAKKNGGAYVKKLRVRPEREKGENYVQIPAKVPDALYSEIKKIANNFGKMSLKDTNTDALFFHLKKMEKIPRLMPFNEDIEFSCYKSFNIPTELLRNVLSKSYFQNFSEVIKTSLAEQLIYKKPNLCRYKFEAKTDSELKSVNLPDILAYALEKYQLETGSIINKTEIFMRSIDITLKQLKAKL